MKDKEMLELEELIEILIQKREEFNRCIGDLESAYEWFSNEDIHKAMLSVKKEYTLADLTLKHLSKYEQCIKASYKEYQDQNFNGKQNE